MNGELEVLVLFTVAFGLIGGKSSDDEKDILSSDEEGEHNVENSLLFSLRILRAVRSCKVSYTKKNCVRWL